MSSPLNLQRQAKLEKYKYLPYVARTFSPQPTPTASTDVRHPATNKFYDIGTVWHDTSSDYFYILAGYSGGLADWQQFAVSGSGTITNLTGDDGVMVVPIADNITFTGEAVANATNAKPVYFDGDAGTAVMNCEVQVSAAVVPTPSDKLDAGICSFDNTGFDVDSNGFVTMKGGTGPAPRIIQGNDLVDVQADGNGRLFLIGNTVANATNAKPIFTVGDAPGSIEYIELQVSTERTGAPSDMNDAGICSFDDTAFAVDANGYVTFVGGGSGLVDTISGDDGVTTSPDGGGDIEFNGVAVANATYAKPLYIDQDGVDASLENFNIQVAAAITGAPGDKNDAGICSFDDTSFDVDTDGYVTYIGPGLRWEEVTGTTKAAEVNYGYVCNNASLVTVTLPSTAAFGTKLRICGKGAGGWRLAQNAGQNIQFGSTSTTTGATGRLDSFDDNDAVELVCTTANTTWHVLSSQGNITIV